MDDKWFNFPTQTQCSARSLPTSLCYMSMRPADDNAHGNTHCMGHVSGGAARRECVRAELRCRSSPSIISALAAQLWCIVCMQLGNLDRA